jgi:hypothetical protein
LNTQNLKSPISERLLAAAGIFVFLGGAFIVRFFNPTTAGFFPVCPLFAMTGFACPGCGLTRGFHALFHGDILTALGFNAMIPVYAFIFGYLFIAMIFIAFLGRSMQFRIFKQKYIWGFFILSLVFAVTRNIPAYPFTLLYP